MRLRRRMEYVRPSDRVRLARNEYIVVDYNQDIEGKAYHVTLKPTTGAESFYVSSMDLNWGRYRIV